MRRLVLWIVIAAVGLLLWGGCPEPATAGGGGWHCGCNGDQAPPPIACGAAPFGYGPNCCETRDYCGERIWNGYCEAQYRCRTASVCRTRGGDCGTARLDCPEGCTAVPAAAASLTPTPAAPAVPPLSRGDPPAPTTSPQPVSQKTTWRLEPSSRR